MISPVFWTENRQHAFQMVEGHWRVYDSAGDFIREFSSFKAMCQYIQMNEEE